MSLVLTGWMPVVCWMAACAVHQTIEYLWRPSEAAVERLSSRQSAGALLVIFSGNVIFSGLGVVQIVMAGPWGLAFACLLWSGSFGHAALGSGGSRKAGIAYIAPVIAYFLSIPFLVMNMGLSPVDSLAVIVAALLNGLATLELWSTTERRFESERTARIATHLAYHDPETGRPNRLAFEAAIAAEDPASITMVVAVLGIDRFDDLQAAIGYALGARLISKVAVRLDGVHDGVVARLSASTLGVIFHAQDPAEARAGASRLQAAMTTPVSVDGIDIDVGFTIGLSMRSSSETADRLLEHASIALAAARKAMVGINIFEPSNHSNPAGNLSLMSDMLRSIGNGEISNVYQPKFDLRSGELAAVEALVRWHHPDRGAVPPDQFIPLAEETGRIRELTLDVLSRAVRDQAWLAGQGYTLPFAVNLSGRLLDDADVIQTIIDIARPAAARISMEVTETAMMAHPTLALALLGRLRSAGLGISIDDYGSGLSSLAYLKNIPADELKIDKSFVTGMDRNREDCLLVRSTIALAHSFGLRVVAEGVELARTLEILGQMNCDLAQGYHMARPMPLARLAELLASGVHPRADAVPPSDNGAAIGRLEPDGSTRTYGFARDDSAHEAIS